MYGGTFFSHPSARTFVSSLVAGGVAVSALAASSARAGTIHVPDDYPLVREALAVAAPGDTVLLAEEHHGSAVYEPFVVRPGVTVIGDGDVENVIWSVAVGLEFPRNSCGPNPPAVVENISLQLFTSIPMTRSRCTTARAIPGRRSS